MEGIEEEQIERRQEKADQRAQRGKQPRASDLNDSSEEKFPPTTNTVGPGASYIKSVFLFFSLAVPLAAVAALSCGSPSLFKAEKSLNNNQG